MIYVKDKIIVALKSEEFEGNISTYILAFDIQGSMKIFFFKLLLLSFIFATNNLN